MYFSQLAVSAALAMTAAAVPFQHQHLHKRQAQSFDITIVNNCPITREFAIFQVDSAYAYNKMSPTTTVPSQSTGTISSVQFSETGLRLSGLAATSALGMNETLFEFGYGNDGEGQDGTAYNLSLMLPGSTEGILVEPKNTQCHTKQCWPTNCPADQGWTSPADMYGGSPADDGCYINGPTDFTVTWCPGEN